MAPSVSNYFLLSLLGVGALAGPVTIPPVDVEIVQPLSERLATIDLGSHVVDHEWQRGDVLFDGTLAASVAGVAAGAELKVGCNYCSTWGTIGLSTNGVTKSTGVLDLENAADSIIENFGLELLIDLQNIGGFFDLNLEASEPALYTHTLFESQADIVVSVGDEVTVSAVVILELVLSLSEALELEAGFEVDFAEGLSLTVDAFTGNVIDRQGFAGGAMDSLPVTIRTGSGQFTAALRVVVQVGVTVDLDVLSVDFELGAFADLPKFVGTISETEDCGKGYAIDEEWLLDVGVLAKAVVSIDQLNFGAFPTVAITVATGTLPPVCSTASQSLISATTGSASLTTPVVALTSGFASGSGVSGGISQLTSASPVPSALTTGISGGIAGSSASASVDTSILASGGVGPVKSSASAASPWSNGTLTTSVVYATSVYTVTSCAASVTNCPAHLASEVVVTATVADYTTICPVEESQRTRNFTAATSAPPTTSARVTPITPTAPVALSSCSTPVVGSASVTVPSRVATSVPAASAVTTASAPIIESASVGVPAYAVTPAASSGSAAGSPSELSASAGVSAYTVSPAAGAPSELSASAGVPAYAATTAASSGSTTPVAGSPSELSASAGVSAYTIAPAASSGPVAPAESSIVSSVSLPAPNAQGSSASSPSVPAPALSTPAGSAPGLTKPFTSWNSTAKPLGTAPAGTATSAVVIGTSSAQVSAAPWSSAISVPASAPIGTASRSSAVPAEASSAPAGISSSWGLVGTATGTTPSATKSAALIPSAVSSYAASGVSGAPSASGTSTTTPTVYTGAAVRSNGGMVSALTAGMLSMALAVMIL